MSQDGVFNRFKKRSYNDANGFADTEILDDDGNIQPKQKPSRLRTVFNAVAAVGAGMGAAAVVKTALTALAVTAPPVAAAFAVAAAAGAVGGLASHVVMHVGRNLFQEKKEKFSIKAAAKAMVFGALGGGLFEALFGANLNAIETAQNAPVGEELEFADLGIADREVDVAPALPATLGEQVVERVKDMNLSEAAKQSLERLGSDNAAVAAQAKKDFATFFYNGMHGVTQDQAFAVELFKEAAAEGNVQAMRDLAYIEFHGNAAAGVERAIEPALEKMETLVPLDKTGLAGALMDSWTAIEAPADMPLPPPVEQTDSLTLPDGTVFDEGMTDNAAPAEAADATEAFYIASQASKCVAEIGDTIRFTCQVQDGDALLRLTDGKPITLQMGIGLQMLVR